MRGAYYRMAIAGVCLVVLSLCLPYLTIDLMAKHIWLLWAYLAIGATGFVLSLFGFRGRYLRDVTRPAVQCALTDGMAQDSSADGRFEIETLDDGIFATPAKELRSDLVWFQSGEWTPPAALVVRRITFFGEGPAGLTRYVFDYDPHQPLKAEQGVRICCTWVRKNDGGWEYEGPLLTTVASRPDAFYRLIDADDLEGCQLQVKSGADPCQLGSHGQTWLHYAAMKGRLAITRWLIDCGVSVNAATVGGHGDLIGETALHVAARYGHLEVVKTLLEAKADVNATCHVMRGGSRVNSPLDLAKLGGHAEVVALLSEAGGLEAPQWS